MRDYELQLRIGGCVKFEYAHNATEALQEAGQSLANQMDQL